MLLSCSSLRQTLAVALPRHSQIATCPHSSLDCCGSPCQPQTCHEATLLSSMEALASAWSRLCCAKSDATPPKSNLVDRVRQRCRRWPSHRHDARQRLTSCFHKHRRLFACLTLASSTEGACPGPTLARDIAGICHAFLADLHLFLTHWAHPMPSLVRFHVIQTLHAALDALAATFPTGVPSPDASTPALLWEDGTDAWDGVAIAALAPPTPDDAASDRASFGEWAEAAFHALVWRLTTTTRVGACREAAAPHRLPSTDAIAFGLLTWAVAHLSRASLALRPHSTGCTVSSDRARVAALYTLTLTCTVTGALPVVAVTEDVCAVDELVAALGRLPRCTSADSPHGCGCCLVAQLLARLDAAQAPRLSAPAPLLQRPCRVLATYDVPDSTAHQGNAHNDSDEDDTLSLEERLLEAQAVAAYLTSRPDFLEELERA